jgi:hypothetical protein
LKFASLSGTPDIGSVMRGTIRSNRNPFTTYRLWRGEVRAACSHLDKLACGRYCFRFPILHQAHVFNRPDDRGPGDRLVATGDCGPGQFIDQLSLAVIQY